MSKKMKITSLLILMILLSDITSVFSKSTLETQMFKKFVSSRKSKSKSTVKNTNPNQTANVNANNNNANVNRQQVNSPQANVNRQQVNAPQANTQQVGNRPKHPYALDAMRIFGLKAFNYLADSKVFNFLLGAAINTIDILSSNPAIGMIKCGVEAVVSLYKNYKTPAQIQAAMEKDTLNEDGVQVDITGNAQEAIKAQIGAKQADCEIEGAILAVEEDVDSEMLELMDPDLGFREAKIAEELIGGDECDPVQNNNNPNNQAPNNRANGQAQNTANNGQGCKKRKNPFHFLKKYGFAGLKEKIKNSLKKLKNKIVGIFGKVTEYFKLFTNFLKGILIHPLFGVGASFILCMIPEIVDMTLTLIDKSIDWALIFSDDPKQLMDIATRVPKVIKGIISGLKDIRDAYMKSNSLDDLREKYMTYGKGVSNIIIYIIFAVIGKKEADGEEVKKQNDSYESEGNVITQNDGTTITKDKLNNQRENIKNPNGKTPNNTVKQLVYPPGTGKIPQ